MLDFINRVRKFDPRELTPIQIVVGVAAVLVAIWVFWQIVRLALTLLPIAAGVLILYLAYRWLSSRSEELPEEATKSRNQKAVDEALANVRAATAGVFGSSAEEDAADVAESPPAEVIAEESATVETQAETAVTPEEESRLRIQQVVNPETGFKEPDISRLIEEEEEKLKEADRVNEEVMSQIEERRRRLLGK